MDYESIYNAAARGVTIRDTEIDRLQRAIYNRLPHDEAAAIINGAPIALQRRIMRDTEANRLKQKLDADRTIRDKVVAQKSDDVISFAYQVVAVQGSVNQAKKALYMHLRANSNDSLTLGGNNVKHKDL